MPPALLQLWSIWWVPLAVKGILALWALWGLYVLLMGLYRAHITKRLSKPAKVLALPFLIVGYVLDVFVNVFIATFLFWELPRSFLLTARLESHLKSEGRRGKLARWICTKLLDVFDPSDTHCRVAPRPPHDVPLAVVPGGISAEQLDVLVQRFLQWPVPAYIAPDGTPGQPGRTGTNLLDAVTARQMLVHIHGA